MERVRYYELKIGEVDPGTFRLEPHCYARDAAGWPIPRQHDIGYENIPMHTLLNSARYELAASGWELSSEVERRGRDQFDDRSLLIHDKNYRPMLQIRDLLNRSSVMMWHHNRTRCVHTEVNNYLDWHLHCVVSVDFNSGRQRYFDRPGFDCTKFEKLAFGRDGERGTLRLYLVRILNVEAYLQQTNLMGEAYGGGDYSFRGSNDPALLQLLQDADRNVVYNRTYSLLPVGDEADELADVRGEMYPATKDQSTLTTKNAYT